MVVALAALAVALGSAAFAALPDSNGVIHACYQRNSGDLRIVDAADACRKSEQAIAWNQKGPPGSPGGNIVARLRGGPLAAQPGGVPVPLSRETWSQQAGEFQVLFLDARVAEPVCAVRLTVFLDGKTIDQYVLDEGFPHPAPQHALVQIPLFEPETPTEHTLSARISPSGPCGPDNRTGVLEYLKANVVSFG